jgi:hypothetical protein
MVLDVPSWGEDSRERDKWLRNFWKQEPLLAGVVNTITAIDKNRGWSFIGGRNQVARYTRVLRNAHEGTGWRRYAYLQSESYWTSDLGAVTEIGRSGAETGPLTAIWSVDPARCKLTGNPDAPLEYDPSATGKPQDWLPTDFFRCVSMPTTDETKHELGYSFVSRCVELAAIMVAVFRHDREMLFSMMPKGLLLLQGISQKQWEDALEYNDAQLTQREREFFRGVMTLGGEGDVDGKLLSFSQLPRDFDLTEFVDVLMYAYALEAGYDPREFWPVSGGTLGTGRETEMQAVKASAKGELDFVLSWQDKFQRELPSSLHFEFEQRDDAGLQAEAEAIQAYSEAVNAMSESPVQGMETLTREERRFLYAQRGYILDDWTLPEEDVTTTDTDDSEAETRLRKQEKERLLSKGRVRLACERYKTEPIVRYRYPENVLDVLWWTGADALYPERVYSIPSRTVARQSEPEVLYESDDDSVEITVEDVERAIAKWERRQPQEYRGLLEAEDEREEP